MGQHRVRTGLGIDAGDARDVVAWRDGSALTRARFLDDVASLSAELAQRAGQRWLLATESTYACAVALYATWCAGRTAVLPPNRELGTLAELAGDVAGLVTDRDLGPEGLERLAVFDARRTAGRTNFELELEHVGIELCTSGSTGKRKVVHKTPRQLLAEVETLEATFGELARDARVLGSVSHQHIYGLLFRVLWPLRAGRAFVDESAVDPARLVAQLSECERALLIASPAHLERLHEFVELETLAPRCVAVFSSGGPLGRQAALRFERALGAAPIEVLGSTETGGIAWRRRRAEDEHELWTVFRDALVEVRDGLLSVASPNTAGERWVTGDAIELADERHFRLLGRADRIVKLFEERVALPEVEARLVEHPWVARAAALVVERGGAQRLGVAFECTSQGERELAGLGRAAFHARLRAHLAPYFRATVLPRAWRCVARIPEDLQGKRNLELLRRLFEDLEPEPDYELAPPFVGTPQRGDSALVVELEIPLDPWYVRGHFEGTPIVPGVVQIQWAVAGAALLVGREVVPSEVLALKFKDMLVPGTRLRLELAFDDARKSLKFRFASDAKEFSSGRLVLAP